MPVSRRDMVLAGCTSLLALGSRSNLFAKEKSALPTHLSGPLADLPQACLVWEVAANGYIAEEYLLSGTADTFESVSMADAVDTNTRDNVADQSRRSFSLQRTGAAQFYCTRLVVYRPAKISRFSGNVVMETTHPIGGGTNIVWRSINSFFMDRGDAYVAVQHPATLPGLAKADRARYGALKSVHPSQLWGMLADAGALLKAARPTALLAGARLRSLYMTGYSFTGVATATFADYHHDQTRLAGGAPVFDGYMPIANAMYVKPLDVPVMRLNTQSDFDSFGGLANRAPDSDAARGRFRHYEVAGASHVWSERPQPAAAVPPQGAPLLAPPGQPHLDPAACFAQFPQGYKPNDFPLNLVMAQAFVNLYGWAAKGIPPPPGAHIEVDAQGRTQLDPNGNALGGVRLPEVSVPTATYGVAHGEQCFLFGYRLPFDAAKMKRLYGSKDAYVEQVSAAARQLVAQRVIQETGADELQRTAGLIDPF